MAYSSIRGPKDAKVLILGDCPTKNELAEGIPFSSSGALFFVKELFNASGIKFSDCRAMTALDWWPPRGDPTQIFHTKTEGKKLGLHSVHGEWVNDRALARGKVIWTEIDRLQPDFIICLGPVALWYLTGESSIVKWRGSKLWTRRPWGSCPILPTFAPGAVMRKKEWKNVLRHDLASIDLSGDSWVDPKYSLTIHHELVPLLERLDNLHTVLEDHPMHLSVDVETRAGYITVLGFASSPTEADVIPFTHFEQGNTWTPTEEWEIMRRVKRILEHPNAQISGQNYGYDFQYLAKLYGIRSQYTWDSMHMQHVFTTKNLPLSLDFLSSLHCKHYVYWKDDGKDFHNTIKTEDDQQTYWRYNGLDCCRTYEVVESLLPAVSTGWAAPVYDFQQSMVAPVQRSMSRGIRFNRKLQKKFLGDLRLIKSHYEAWFDSLLPPEWFPKPKTPAALAKYSPWWDSAHKQKELFYGRFQLDPIMKRNSKGGKSPSTDDAALTVIAKREPVFALVCQKLKEYRSINLYISLYLTAPTSQDGRMRTSYDLAGTSTFRLASRKDPFGEGLNLQNITKGD